MASPPSLPVSESTVSVSIIDTTSKIRGVQAQTYVAPPVKGLKYLPTPCWSFLVQHKTLHRSLLFDLGIRRDWENLSPAVLQDCEEEGCQLEVTKDVRQILEDGGVTTGSIEAIIWSHHHFDHIGDASRFPPSTAVIVGPGFKEAMLPGYPADKESSLLESDYAGRELREISFVGPQALSIGRFKALDYFEDGSFYLLDAPGHTVGHLCALARVNTNPDAFVLMGGDAANHGAEIRPTRYQPLPDNITPNPFQRSSPNACPGHIFEKLLRRGNRADPFWEAPSDADGHEDVPTMRDSLEKLKDLDAHSNVLVIVAHDETPVGVVDFFPSTLDDYLQKEWAEELRWRFLRDFADAVGWQEPVERGENWAPVPG